MQTIIQVLKVLKQLHSAGYAHRNIKPSNILQPPSHPEWTLVDFACCAALGAPPLHSSHEPRSWDTLNSQTHTAASCISTMLCILHLCPGTRFTAPVFSWHLRCTCPTSVCLNDCAKGFPDLLQTGVGGQAQTLLCFCIPFSMCA